MDDEAGVEESRSIGGDDNVSGENDGEAATLGSACLDRDGELLPGFTPERTRVGSFEDSLSDGRSVGLSSSIISN
jgi:hypothetical protein